MYKIIEGLWDSAGFEKILCIIGILFEVLFLKVLDKVWGNLGGFGIGYGMVYKILVRFRFKDFGDCEV